MTNGRNAVVYYDKKHFKIRKLLRVAVPKLKE